MSQAATRSLNPHQIVERIEPQAANQALKSNPNAFLVCAYDDDEKCRRYYLEGAMTLREFEVRQDSIPKDSEIIFYCA